jgi:preprotein translocase subunit SecG
MGNHKIIYTVMKTKGTGVLEVLVVVAILGLGALWFKPTVEKIAAKQVDKVTTELLATDNAIDQKVSASVNQIGVANSLAPESPSKEFIAREVTLITPMLPVPSMEDLLAAEKRRLAVMEGRLAEANNLYGSARKDNEKLIAENVRALKELDDLKVELYEKAAVAEFLKRTTIVVSVVLFVLGGAYVWLRINYNKVFGGVREFLTYNKDEKTLAEMREAMDSDVKKELGL